MTLLCRVLATLFGALFMLGCGAHPSDGPQLFCNGGMTVQGSETVTDLRDCPEYREPEIYCAHDHRTTFCSESPEEVMEFIWSQNMRTPARWRA